MGQPIEEPKGTLTLYVKALRPQQVAARTEAAIKQVWIQDRVVVDEFTCTYREAEHIVSIHRKLNGEQNATATWEGSVTL